MSDQGQERPLETRVEDLFSNAVERQVAERRAVGRALEELGNLVRSLDDRLGRLESADQDRDKRLDRIATELGTSIETVRSGDESGSKLDEVAGTLERLAGRLDQLEAGGQSREGDVRDAIGSVGEHVQRLSEQVEQAVGEGLEQVARRQQEGQESLERAVLAAATEAGSELDLDALAARISERVQAPPIDLDRLSDNLAARMTPKIDTGRLAAELVTQLSAPDVDVDALAANLASVLQAPAVDVEALAGQVADRIAPPAVDLDALVDHLGARLQPPSIDVDELVDLLAVRLRVPGVDAEELAERVAQASPPVDVGVIAEAVAGRVQVPSVLQVASAVDASIRDGLVAVVDDVREEVDRLRTELVGIRAEVADGAATIAPLSSRLATQLDDVNDALDAVRGGLRQAAEDRDRTSSVLVGQVHELVAGTLDARLDGLRALLDEQLAGASNLREDVRESLASLHSTTEAMAGDLDGVRDIRDKVAEQSERLDRLATELPAGDEALRSQLDEVRRAVEERLDAVASELPEATTAAATTASDELGRRLEGLVKDLATELGGALAAVAERAEGAESGTTSRLTEFGGTLDEVAARIGALQGHNERVVADLDAQSQALAEMAGDLTGFAETVGRVLGEVQVSLRADQDAALDRVQALVDRSQERVDEAAARMDEGASSALARIDTAAETVVGSSEGLHERLQSVLDEIAGATRRDADEARDEVVAASARLDLLFDRLAGFERAILSHLVARENQFVQERQLLTQSLVEQLATSIGKRERKKLASRLEPPVSPIAAIEPLPVPEPTTPEPGDRELDVDVPRRPVTVSPQESGRQEVVPATRAASAGRSSAKRAASPGRKKAPAKRSSASRKPAAKGSGARKKASSGTRAARTPRVSRDDLIAVKGLGPAKVDALLEALGSPTKVARASVEDLAAVPGISERLARLVHDHLADRAT